MDNQFLRTQMLLGDEAMDALRHSHVAVFGLGGVGSYAVEALVRSGVGELTLIDDDTVAPTNLNRQLEALHSTVGRQQLNSCRGGTVSWMRSSECAASARASARCARMT